jgi:ankyrin repeat protein
MIACEFGCVDACRALLRIPGIDVNATNNEGVSFD